MTIDEPMLGEVERVTLQLGITRSAFIRHAIRLALKQQKTSLMERTHREGWATKPVEAGEFDIWETEQEWENLLSVGR
ncbi:ribbon-helix-helix protein, CopG family [Neomoorella thermoacetica]|uniref:ribbon-helix-helix protein, CopG family n=1 Tax=Neomoorella thermoacetica TaxID=1525 RepID=UPI0030CE7064